MLISILVYSLLKCQPVQLKDDEMRCLPVQKSISFKSSIFLYNAFVYGFEFSLNSQGQLYKAGKRSLRACISNDNNAPVIINLTKDHSDYKRVAMAIQFIVISKCTGTVDPTLGNFSKLEQHISTYDSFESTFNDLSMKSVVDKLQLFSLG